MKVEAPVFYRTAFVFILLFVSLTCCLPIPIPKRDVKETSFRVAHEERPTATIPWLIEEKTTKEAVIRNENLRDIIPRSLSQGKILVYCINFDEKKDQFVGSIACDHQLVLVFDERDIVKQFSILKMYYEYR